MGIIRMFAPALAYGGAGFGAYGPAAYGAYGGYGGYGGYGLGFWDQKHQGQHGAPMHLMNLEGAELQEEDFGLSAALSAAAAAVVGYCSANPCVQQALDKVKQVSDMVHQFRGDTVKIKQAEAEMIKAKAQMNAGMKAAADAHHNPTSTNCTLAASTEL